MVLCLLLNQDAADDFLHRWLSSYFVLGNITKKILIGWQESKQTSAGSFVRSPAYPCKLGQLGKLEAVCSWEQQ